MQILILLKFATVLFGKKKIYIQSSLAKNISNNE